MKSRTNILNNNEGGFTLIEAMVSALILTVGILATLDLVGVAIKAERTGKDITIANNLAKQVIENMKNVGYTNMTTWMASGTATDLRYFKTRTPDATKKALPDALKFQNVSTSNKCYVIMVHVKENEPKPALAHATVNVYWNQPMPNTTANYLNYLDPKSHKVSYNTYLNMD